MKIRLSFLTILFFLSLQFLSLLHVSEVAVVGHEHQGEVCQICLNLAHSNALPDSAVAESMDFGLFVLQIGWDFDFSYSSNSYQTFLSRAPPYFS